MRVNLNSFLFGLLVCMLFFSCKKVAFEQTHDIDSQGWSKSKPAIFDVMITDVTHPYSIEIQVSNGDEYRFSNLYLFVDIFMPNKKLVRDTVDCILANSKGEWSGSGWWAPFKNRYPFKRNVLFPVVGKYRIVLEQAMRCDESGLLTDISGVGIKIEQE